MRYFYLLEAINIFISKWTILLMEAHAQPFSIIENFLITLNITLFMAAVIFLLYVFCGYV